MSVFISYAREDAPAAEELYTRLRMLGLEPWLDAEKILPGHPWAREIEQAIKRSAIFVALLSTRSVSKQGFVQEELEMALRVLEQMPEGCVYLVPVRLDDCEIPPRLQAYQWVDYFAEAGPARLTNAIAHHLNQRSLGRPGNGMGRAPGLEFADVRIAAADLNWTEAAPTGRRSRMGRMTAQMFVLSELVYGADPTFDVTVLNASAEGLILTRVGVELVSVLHVAHFYGVPEPAKILPSDAYTVRMPDVLQLLRDRDAAGEELPEEGPVDLGEVVAVRVPDPIYLPPGGPYRYTLRLDRYFDHVPNHAIIRMWAGTHRGEHRSADLETFTM
jgi:hypothetical protein